MQAVDLGQPSTRSNARPHHTPGAVVVLGARITDRTRLTITSSPEWSGEKREGRQATSKLTEAHVSIRIRSEVTVIQLAPARPHPVI